MKNLKIAMKLIVSFLIVIALSIIVGVVGIIGMYNMNVGDDALYNGNYLPTVMAGNISQIVVEQRVSARNFVIYDVNLDAETFTTAKRTFDESKTRMDSLLAEYEDTIVLQEDQEAFDEFENVYRNEWLPGMDSIYNFGLANQAEEAKAALTKTTEIAGRMDVLTTNLQEFNLNDGQNTVDANTRLFTSMATIEVVVLVIAVAVALFFALYVSSLISKPMMFLKNVLYEMGARGRVDFSEEEYRQAGILAQARDEAGQSIQMLINTGRHFELVGKSLERIADGDLTEDIELLSEADTLGNYMRKMIGNLSNMFGEINNATTQVASGSKQIADGSQALAQGSTEQAAAVEQLSSSIAEIAQKTKDNAALADRAANLANSIKGNAETGSRQMDDMMAAVKDINDASQSINKVIKVIDDIAFQTNILALNAAVEAARAGQHGKGFAVVAEEVRNLAAKSAEAAKETGSMIANSIEKAELGAKIADDTASSLAEIVSGINESTQLVAEIAKSSEEQSEGISQINRGIDQVAQVVQQNSATAEESAAASEEMSGQSDMLQSLVAQFKLKDSGRQRVLAAGTAGGGSHPAQRLVLPEKGTAPAGDFGKY